ncbi:hypothetical protein P3X46_008656 [Hevea brasiliensis]|uniref:Uncharacterized protein n=1 Tax=Hevea brasiliensis TaxID=3981 RepID=A0ABQ9MJB7_HEVBR|nr:hypothetical protein P3X46_008656 [Hevea brasiliensis]
MRRAYRRMWRAVPCTSRTILRTESRKDIEEILKTKLATIKEEPEPAETSEEKRTPVRGRLQVAKSAVKRKISSNKVKKGSRFNLKESYALFMAAGFASKGSSIGGLVQY